MRVMPSSSLGCGQSCLLLSIAAAIIIMAIACFGLWAIADYLMLNVYHLDYRTPLGGMILPLQNLLCHLFLRGYARKDVWASGRIPDL
ncbi:MAG: hypothetical protein M5U34_29730 [Chloroflexi bacterium]|nr:hypothetical protein [Chloroflexota bacterium]